MKIYKKIRNIVYILSITFVLAGCSFLPSDLENDVDADSEYITVGGLTVHNTDTRLTVLDKMDALSADGLYYASWTAGDSEPYENSDGDTVDLYDAQLYLLLGEYKSSGAAQENMDNWLNAGKTNYDIIKEETITCSDQSYTMITYNFTNEENPYAHGVSAFGVHDNIAVCAELTCREDYQEDLREMLMGFLDNCTYN